MKSQFNKIEEVIKNLAFAEKISFKKHCTMRMIERGIKAEYIKDALLNSEIIIKYSDDKPYPSYLLLGYYNDKKPLHILLAIDDEISKLWIITVYIPDPEIWTSNFKERA